MCSVLLRLTFRWHEELRLLCRGIEFFSFRDDGGIEGKASSLLPSDASASRFIIVPSAVACCYEDRLRGDKLRPRYAIKK